MSLTDEIIQRYNDTRTARMAQEEALQRTPLNTLADVGFQSNASNSIGMLNQGIGNLVSLANIGNTRAENQRQANVEAEALAYQREKDLFAQGMASGELDVAKQNAETSKQQAKNQGRANDLAEAKYNLGILQINEQNRILRQADAIATQMNAEDIKKREANRLLMEKVPDSAVMLDKNNKVIGFSGEYADLFKQYDATAGDPLSVHGKAFNGMISQLAKSQVAGVPHLTDKQLTDIIYASAENKFDTSVGNTTSQQAVLKDRIAEGDLLDKEVYREQEMRQFLKTMEDRSAYEQQNKGTSTGLASINAAGMSPNQLQAHLQGQTMGKPRYGTAVDDMSPEQVKQAFEENYTFPGLFREFQAQNTSFEQNSAPFQSMDKNFGEKLTVLNPSLTTDDIANAQEIAENANEYGAKWVDKYNREYGTKFEINDPYVQTAIWNAIQQGNGVNQGFWVLRDANIKDVKFDVIARNLRKLEGFKALKGVQGTIATNKDSRDKHTTALHLLRTAGTN